jgi:hypothetical protein
MKILWLFILIALFLTGCMKQNPQVIKETDANKKVVLTFYNTAFNEQEPHKAVDAFSGTAEALSIKGDSLLKGRTEIANSLSGFLNSFTNVRFKPEWTYAEGEMVIVRWVITGTPRGIFFEHPAGVPLEIRGAAFLRLVERKIVHSITYWNIK